MSTPPLAPEELAASRPRRHDECPNCGTPTLPGQEYCLECGSRLPPTRAGLAAGADGGRRVRAREVWAWPALVSFVVAALATAGVIALRAAGDDQEALLVATTDQGAAVTQTVTIPPLAPNPIPQQPTETTRPQTPSPPRTATQPPARPGPGLTSWPAGRTGYTIVLSSLPERGGQAEAASKARQASKAGLLQVGVLRSSRFASLHPGYYVVFSGIYGTMTEAGRAVGRARDAGYASAYARLIAP